jgi:hypothetical protein
MPCREHSWFYMSQCPRCDLRPKGEQTVNESVPNQPFAPVLTEGLIKDIMNDLTDIPTKIKPKYQPGNPDKITFEFNYKVLVEGDSYILTEALNNQPRARWLAKSREQINKLLARRKQLLEETIGEVYAAEAVRVVVQ